MRITSLRRERGPSFVRAAARIEWEDCGREPLELVFESEADAGFDLEPTAEAFLTACALPAMREGERRITIAAEVSPRLAAGVNRAIQRLAGWYGASRRTLAIEPVQGFRAARRRAAERTAMCFTGGIDSRHMLQVSRREELPAGAPPIQDALSTFGHLCPTTPATRAWNARVVPMLASAAKAEGLVFVAVRTNVFELAPDVAFLARESLGSAIVASAHLFPQRWTRMLLSSGHERAHQPLHGTHPDLDPAFSSEAVEIVHVASARSRLERLAIAASAAGGVEDLIVCLAFPGPPTLNCGECEKCVRTMAQLLVLGELGRARHFPRRDVSAEMIRGVTLVPTEARYWRQMLPALDARGRTDLTTVLREKLEDCRRLERWNADAGWKGRLRRWDRRFLEGRLLGLSRRMRGQP